MILVINRKYVYDIDSAQILVQIDVKIRSKMCVIKHIFDVMLVKEFDSSNDISCFLFILNPIEIWIYNLNIENAD